MNKPYTKRQWGIFILLLGLLTGGVLYASIHTFVQEDVTYQVSQWLQTFVKNPFDTSDLHYSKMELDLTPEGGFLVKRMKDDYLEVGVSNREAESLIAQVVSSDQMRSLPAGLTEDELPWFYNSPQVAKDSPYSYANQYRLVEDEGINELRWYEYQGERYLFQGDKLYTGWHQDTDGEYLYYNQGVIQPTSLSQDDLDIFIGQSRIIKQLSPSIGKSLFFERNQDDYKQMYSLKSNHYSILYKATDQLILSSPPGTRGSVLVASTKNFYDMPLEVVEEYRSENQVWLHVMVGYDELGWIQQDLSRTHYVPTYYSERTLLDTIEAVLQEEVDSIAADVGASFINNETMAQVSVNDHPFFPASTQKIYVLGELYHQYRTGELDPYQVVTLYDSDRVPGAGIIQGYPTGSQFYIDELVDLVAIYSDNTAANMLIDTVGGGEKINPRLQQIGLFDTYVYGKYYGEDTYLTTTPSNAARFFALLYNNRLNGEPYDDMLVNKLFMNTHTFLRSYLYGGATTSYNKSGLGSSEQNDVATFITPYGSYSLAVYTAYPANYDTIADSLAMLSLRVHDAFNEVRSDLWIKVEE